MVMGSAAQRTHLIILGGVGWGRGRGGGARGRWWGGWRGGGGGRLVGAALAPCVHYCSVQQVEVVVGMTRPHLFHGSPLLLCHGLFNGVFLVIFHNFFLVIYDGVLVLAAVPTVCFANVGMRIRLDVLYSSAVRPSRAAD